MSKETIIDEKEYYEQISQRDGVKRSEDVGYFAIIPAPVRYNKVLPSTAKLLYGEISSLTHREGYCYASNEYFARIYDISKDRVSKLIASLEEQKFINIEVLRNLNKQVVERRITCLCADNAKITRPTVENDDTPIGKNDKDNKKSFNKNNNTLSEDSLRSSSVPKAVNPIKEINKAGYDNLVRYLEKNNVRELIDYIEIKDDKYILTDNFWNNYWEMINPIALNNLIETIVYNPPVDDKDNKTETAIAETGNLKETEQVSFAAESDSVVSQKKPARRTRKAQDASDDDNLSNLSAEAKQARLDFLNGFMTPGSEYQADGKSPRQVKAEKKAKAKKPAAALTPVQQVKAHYVENVQKLNALGKTNIERPTTNSALINKRIGAILKDVSVERIFKVLDAEMDNDFCVYTVQYDLSKILSDNVFNKTLNSLPKEAPKPVMKNIKVAKVKLCPKCGEKLNSFGTCSWCD